MPKVSKAPGNLEKCANQCGDGQTSTSNLPRGRLGDAWLPRLGVRDSLAPSYYQSMSTVCFTKSRWCQRLVDGQWQDGPEARRATICKRLSISKRGSRYDTHICLSSTCTDYYRFEIHLQYRRAASAATRSGRYSIDKARLRSVCMSAGAEYEVRLARQVADPPATLGFALCPDSYDSCEHLRSK